MTKNRKTLLLSATLLASSLYMPHLFANPVKLISGAYYQKKVAFPLLLASQDRDQSWSFIKNVPLLSNHVSHFLNTVSCDNNQCFAGGYLGAPMPSLLLMHSQDQGQTWSYVTKIANQPNMEAAYLADVGCYKGTCFAAGTYFGEDNVYPALVTSQDGGINWTFVNQITNAPKDATGIWQVMCTDQSCVGLLESEHPFNGNLKDKPIFSKDHGQTWTYVTNIEGVPQHKGIQLQSLDCANSLCFASGRYLPAQKKSDPLPLLASSQDGGEHWQAVPISNLPSMTYGEVTSIQHQNTVWVAAGKYSDTKSTEMTHPLLLSSKDRGAHWSYVTNVTGLPDKSIHLQTVECNQYGLCVAGGYYLKNVQAGDGYELPILLVSHDFGYSYHFVTNINNLPALKGATINSLSCENDACTAIGHYDSMKSGRYHDDAISFPLVLTSQDQAEHWQAMTLNGLPTMQSGEAVSITGGKGNIFSSPKV
jgi:hypothetical protein